jgi:hypothetical protein
MSLAIRFAQLARIESYAPMMNYLVPSMLSGGHDLGRALVTSPAAGRPRASFHAALV